MLTGSEAALVQDERDARVAVARGVQDKQFPRLATAVFVGGTFLVSRIVAYLIGVRFEPEMIVIGWQFLDLSWLREDLVGSIVNLHSNPPLVNVALGALTTLLPGREAVVLYPGFVLMGLLTALAMLDLLRRLGVSAPLAVAATLLFSLSPSALLYEHWFFYMHPIACVLVLAVWAFVRYATAPTFGRGLLAWSLAAIPVLTWSLFHLAWFVVLAGVVAAVHRAGASRTLASAAVPLVVLLGWYGKNLVLFGDFTPSTWVGQNLYRVAVAHVSDDDLQQLAGQRVVPPIALIPDFSPLSAYDDVIAPPPQSGVPALDVPTKSAGDPNYNHIGYIAVSDAYFDAATDLLRARPEAYAETLIRGLCRYMTPSSNYWFLRGNREHLLGYERLYSAAVYGQARPAVDGGCYLASSPSQFPLFFPLLFGTATVGATWLAVRAREPHVRVAMAAVAATFAWVTLAGNAFEFGENNRFRFVTEPLMWIALAVVAERLLRRVRRSGRKQRRGDRKRKTHGQNAGGEHGRARAAGIGRPLIHRRP